MKTINLFTAEFSNGLPPQSYKELILACVRHVPQGGLQFDEQVSRMRLLDKIDELKDDATELLLEDADAALLVRLIKAMAWAVVDPAIAIFGKDVIENCNA